MFCTNQFENEVCISTKQTKDTYKGSLIVDWLPWWLVRWWWFSPRLQLSRRKDAIKRDAEEVHHRSHDEYHAPFCDCLLVDVLYKILCYEKFALDRLLFENFMMGIRYESCHCNWLLGLLLIEGNNIKNVLRQRLLKTFKEQKLPEDCKTH